MTQVLYAHMNNKKNSCLGKLRDNTKKKKKKMGMQENHFNGEDCDFGSDDYLN
jgi:hypothetical protein